MKKHLTIFIAFFYIMFYSMEVLSQNSISLNGVTDFIEVLDDQSLSIDGSFTIEAWIKSFDNSGEKTILIKGNNGQCGNYGLFIKDGNLAYASGGDCRWSGRGTNSALALGTWQHVAAVGDNDNLKLYIDGILKDEITLSSTLGPPNNDALWIGRSIFVSNNFFFNGSIDEVRIWNVARSQSEIQNHMKTELSGLESNLLLYYKLDDVNQECDILDCTTNENHGSRINIDDHNNLPQLVNDQTTNLTDVECGVELSNCLSFESVFQLFVDSVNFKLRNDNVNNFFNDQTQVLDLIAELQFFYSKRTEIVDPFYDFLTSLCNDFPQYFKINRAFDHIQFTYLGSFREQIHIYLRDYLREYPDKEEEFLLALDLTNPNSSEYFEIWNSYKILIIDNFNLSQLQLNVINDLLSTIPNGVTNLGVIMFREFYTNNFQNVLLTQSVSFINSFGTPIGISSYANAFPDNFITDGFSYALSHEICHTIDYDYLIGNERLFKWKVAMLAAAGTTDNEYLTTWILDANSTDYYQVYPQEFFAYISGAYFGNSLLTLDLAIQRFSEGYEQPINQFLLMADVLSTESDNTQFYTIDQNSNINLSFHEIRRNNKGFISALNVTEFCKYEFIYDQNDFVVEIIAPESSCDGGNIITSTKDEINQQIKVYPNPTSDFIYLDYPATAQLNIKLFDLSGRFILEQNNGHRINLMYMPDGVYFLELEGIKTSKKIVKMVLVMH